MRIRLSFTSVPMVGWLVKAMAIFALVAVVTAFQFSPVTAPAPDMAVALVSFAMLTLPAELPESAQAESGMPAPASTATPVPTLTPAPASTATPVLTLTPAPTLERLPTDPPEILVTRRPGLSRLAPTASYTLLGATPDALPAIAGAEQAVRVPILMYHYISDPPPGSDSLRRSLSVTPVNLDAQMNYLRQAGYQTITLSDLYGSLTQGRPLPAKPIILTFDDGYVDAYTFAMPVLRQYGMVGTFFVLTGPADRSGAGGYLSWAHIRAMSEAGMDMELHSREHVDLRNRSNDYLVHQIAGAKQSLEAYTGKPVRWFAYPSGRYDAAVVRLLQSAGFWGAVTTIPGQMHTAAGLYDLTRVRIFGSDTLESFKKAVEGKR